MNDFSFGPFEPKTAKEIPDISSLELHEELETISTSVGKDNLANKSIAEMTLAEVEDSLTYVNYELVIEEETYAKIHEEMRILRDKLRALDETRSIVLESINKHKDDKLFLARRKEQMLKDELKNKAIEDTANKVFEIMADNPSWGKAHLYQKEDVVMTIHAYLSGFKGFLNANDMGLGKTKETFDTLTILSVLFEAEYDRKPRILWLTKTSILKTGGTIREGKNWAPNIQLIPVEGSMNKVQREAFFEMIDEFGMSCITNYESVRTTEALQDIEWDFIVMDEVHKLKGGANISGPTAVWKSVFDLTRNCKMQILMSGTPMVNKVTEMWAYLHIFDPERFPSARQFENAFTSMMSVAGEFQLVVDADKLLNNALVGRMCKRRKDEVGLQMPPVTPYEQREVLLEMLPAQKAVYEQMRDQFFVWLTDQDQEKTFTATAIIAQLIRLRQLNVWPVIDFKKSVVDPFTGMPVTTDDGKLLVTVDRLDVRESSKIDEAMDTIEAIGDEAIVIFSTFNEPLREIQRRCLEQSITCDLLIGENNDNLTNLEVGFQQGKIRVLCVNAAMGEGLNLQKNPEQWPGGASYVGFLDLWYNSGRNDQCTDRVFRQGANEAVTVFHWKNEDSVDQWLDEIIKKKDNQIKGIMEDQKLRPGEWAAYLKKLI